MLFFLVISTVSYSCSTTYTLTRLVDGNSYYVPGQSAICLVMSQKYGYMIFNTISGFIFEGSSSDSSSVSFPDAFVNASNPLGISFGNNYGRLLVFNPSTEGKTFKFGHTYVSDASTSDFAIGNQLVSSWYYPNSYQNGESAYYAYLGSTMSRYMLSYYIRSNTYVSIYLNSLLTYYYYYSSMGSSSSRSYRTTSTHYVYNVKNYSTMYSSEYVKVTTTGTTNPEIEVMGVTNVKQRRWVNTSQFVGYFPSTADGYSSSSSGLGVGFITFFALFFVIAVIAKKKKGQTYGSSDSSDSKKKKPNPNQSPIPPVNPQYPQYGQYGPGNVPNQPQYGQYTPGGVPSQPQYGNMPPNMTPQNPNYGPMPPYQQPYGQPQMYNPSYGVSPY